MPVRRANFPNGVSSTPALAASFFIGAVGLASVMNKPMGDRYRHHVREHVPIDFRSYLNYDPTPAMSACLSPKVTGTAWTAMMPPKPRAMRVMGIRPTEVLDVANPCNGRDMVARAFLMGCGATKTTANKGLSRCPRFRWCDAGSRRIIQRDGSEIRFSLRIPAPVSG